jgi:hypothetical protein
MQHRGMAFRYPPAIAGAMRRVSVFFINHDSLSIDPPADEEDLLLPGR